MSDDKKHAQVLEQEPDIANLKALFARGGLSRRDLTSALLGLGIAAPVASMIAADARVAHAESPKHGGRVRAAASSHGPDDTLDPARFSNSTDYCRGEQFYNGLTRINGNLEPEGELAESWDAEPGAQEWVFHLRKDVEFHNGKTLDSQDVIYSIERHLDESVGSVVTTFIEQIDEVKADDKHTVRFSLAGPNADFPVVLGMFNMKIVPDGYTDFSTAIGTGPFTVKEFKPGVRSVGERFANYWDGDKPYLDEVEWFGISDEVARLNALLAGDVQLLSDIGPKAAPAVEQTPGVGVINTASGQFIDVAMMTDRWPGENPDFRMAIKYLLNREDSVRRFYDGFASLGNDHPIFPANPYYCDDIPIRPFDPEKAKFHLQKADMEGATVQLHTAETAGTGATEQALMIQQEAAKIGLNVDVKRVPSDGYWSTTWMQQPMFMSGWNPRPTADTMLTIAYKSDAPWNETRWQNERFDELLVLGRGELDPDKRKEIYCEAQWLIHDTGGTGIPVFFDYVDAMSDDVKGFQQVPLGSLAAGQWPKHIWLDG